MSSLLSAMVVDDHRLFAESFTEVLKRLNTFHQTEICFNIDSARKKLEQSHFNYLFIDLMMPGNDTTAFISECNKLYENLIIIAVSSTTDPFIIKDLFNKGLDAFLSKLSGSYEIQAAIEATWSGEKYLSPNISGKIISADKANSHKNLTKKEIEVVLLVAKGHTIAETAAIMHLSVHTVIGHRRNIMQKLGLRSAIEVVKYAYENKLC